MNPDLQLDAAEMNHMFSRAGNKKGKKKTGQNVCVCVCDQSLLAAGHFHSALVDKNKKTCDQSITRTDSLNLQKIQMPQLPL